MSAFTPIPSLDQLDYEAWCNEADRQGELDASGQQEPPVKYPGFRNVPDEVLRQIIADPQPTAFDDDPQVMIDEAQAELDRRYPPVLAGYVDAFCSSCRMPILVREGTGNGGVCPMCSRQVA